MDESNAKRGTLGMLSPALERMHAVAGLQVLDVGARGKVRREVQRLAPYAHLFACEPDREEAARLEEELRRSRAWKDVTVIPDALGAPGDEMLYVTKKPGMTSLLRPDVSVTGRYANAEVYEVVDEVPVTVRSLDEAAKRWGFEQAALLKLDTQGTELEILQSGREVLQRSALAIFTEANFHPFYTGQSVFSDIDAFLRSHGFVLFDLRKTMMRGRGYEDHLYSQRQVVWAHCLYFRDPDALPVDGDTLVHKSRFVALALAYHHVDTALSFVSGPQGRDLRDAFGHSLPDDVRDVAARLTRKKLRRLSGEEATALLARSGRG